jgi:hypothetical protein
MTFIVCLLSIGVCLLSIISVLVMQVLMYQFYKNLVSAELHEMWVDNQDDTQLEDNSNDKN